MNAVRGQNLSDALMRGENDAGTEQGPGGALGDVTDRARFCRTTATCIWGVSDPLFSSV